MTMTQVAVDKIISIMPQENPPLFGLRVAIQGGGCSGFQYKMQFMGKASDRLLLDKEFKFQASDGQELKVFVDQASMLYLEQCEIDYVETLESAGFKFNNPEAKSTCGCGSSFSG